MVQNLSPLSLDRQKVEILDISKNGLGILASKAVLPGVIMQVRINTAVELAEVRHCAEYDGNRYRIGLRFIAVSDEGPEPFAARSGTTVTDFELPLKPQADRRQAPRQQLSQSAAVSVLGTGELLQGEIRNLSEGGAQVLLHQPLQVTSWVKIEYAGKVLRGEVVYCRQEQSGWVLGIRAGSEFPGVSDLAASVRRCK
jgi:hypothetical protein